MDGVTLEVGLEGQEEQAKWVKKEKGLQAESSVCTTNMDSQLGHKWRQRNQTVQKGWQ